MAEENQRNLEKLQMLNKIFWKLLLALPYENRLSSDSVLQAKKKKKKDDPLEKLESGSFPPIDSILK